MGTVHWIGLQIQCSIPTIHNLRSIMKIAFDNEICGRPHVILKYKLWRPCCIEAKQTQGKKISRHDAQRSGW